MCRICWSAEVKTDVELASKITENAKVGVSQNSNVKLNEKHECKVSNCEKCPILRSVQL